MKVLCKKTYYVQNSTPRFIENNWYEMYINIIGDYSVSDKSEKELRFSKSRFQEFFYTQQELRKLKLKQINDYEI